MATKRPAWQGSTALSPGVANLCLERCPTSPSPSQIMSTSSSSAPAFPGSTPLIICRRAARARAGDPRGAGRGRRDLGPVPLSGHPLRLRHVHFGLPVPAVDRRQSRSPTAPRSALMSRRRRGHSASMRRIRFRHRVTAPSWSSREARWTVEAEAEARTRRFTCGFLFLGSGYYDYDKGYRPHWPGEERLSRPLRPSATLARGPRLCGKRDRRDRQRRDRGHPGARSGRDGGACDDAAALALLYRRPPFARTGSRAGCSAGCRPRRRPTRSAGRTSARHVLLLARPQEARAGAGDSAEMASPSSCPVPTSSGISRRATMPGTSASAWCPTAICSRRSTRAGSRSSPTGSSASPRPGSGSPPARELDADIVVTATGLVVKLLGGIALERRRRAGQRRRAAAATRG